jgi:hypothetical protein
MENKVTAHSYLFGREVVRAYNMFNDGREREIISVLDYLLQDRKEGEYISSDMYSDTDMILEVAQEWDGWYVRVEDSFIEDLIKYEWKRRNLNQ